MSCDDFLLYTISKMHFHHGRVQRIDDINLFSQNKIQKRKKKKRLNQNLISNNNKKNIQIRQSIQLLDLIEQDYFRYLLLLLLIQLRFNKKKHKKIYTNTKKNKRIPVLLGELG